MRIRTATADDAPELARLHIASWRAVFQAELPAAFLDSRNPEAHARIWLRRMSNPALHVRVAENDDRMLGFCACGPTTDGDADSAETWEVHNLHIDPDLRGRGIGTDLLRDAIALGRTAAARRLTLWVVATNMQARRFYEKHAMRTDGAEKRHDVEDGLALREVRYVRDLGPGS